MKELNIISWPTLSSSSNPGTVEASVIYFKDYWAGRCRVESFRTWVQAKRRNRPLAPKIKEALLALNAELAERDRCRH